MEEKSDHRAESHGNVVGKTIIAKTFASAFGWHNVDNNGVTPDSYDTEHQALQSTDDDDHEKRDRDNVATKE